MIGYAYVDGQAKYVINGQINQVTVLYDWIS